MADQIDDIKVITIEDYLGGASPLVTEDMVKMLLVDKCIEPSTNVADMEERDRDLLKADALMWCAMNPSTNGGWEEQVGNWKTKKAGNTLTNSDKAMLKRMARALYRKWEEPWIYPSSVTIVKKGMHL